MTVVIVMGLVGAVDESKVNPGVLGFVVVALLGVATWLLIRSMHRQLRKVDFEETDEDPQTPAPSPPVPKPPARKPPAPRSSDDQA